MACSRRNTIIGLSNVKKLPYGDFALNLPAADQEALAAQLRRHPVPGQAARSGPRDGFILINDYGQTQMTTRRRIRASTVFLCHLRRREFPVLKAFFDESSKMPVGRAVRRRHRGIHSRLCRGSRQCDPTVSLLQQIFSDAGLRSVAGADQQSAAAASNPAASSWRRTFTSKRSSSQPRNWVLLNEISIVPDVPDARSEVRHRHGEGRPGAQSDLLGGLVEHARRRPVRVWPHGGSHERAYEQAMAVNSSDVRSRYNLAWVHAREKDYPAALQLIAEALALDKTGQYRERLLQKQNEVLAAAGAAESAGIFAAHQSRQQVRQTGRQEAGGRGAAGAGAALGRSRRKQAMTPSASFILIGPSSWPAQRKSRVVSTAGLVSIVVPCCGMLEYTKLCVPSILKHTRPPFELIFLDIGSLDGTAEYLAGLQAGLAGQDPRRDRADADRPWASRTLASRRCGKRSANMSCCSTTTALSEKIIDLSGALNQTG